MKPTPIPKALVDNAIKDYGIQDFAKATIREVKQVAAKAEQQSGVEYIKMEMYKNVPCEDRTMFGTHVRSTSGCGKEGNPCLSPLPQLTVSESSEESRAGALGSCICGFNYTRGRWMCSCH